MAKKKMTKEMLAKIQGYTMATGVVFFTPKIIDEEESTSDNIVYVDKDYCPTFEIQLPTNKEYKKIRKTLIAAQTPVDGVEPEPIDELQLTEDILSKHIIGWSNYYGNGLELVEFDKSKVQDLTQKTQAAIFVYISEVTGLI